MKLSVVVEKARVPQIAGYKLGEDKYILIGKIIADDIQQKIKQQERADGGGTIKQNAPSTRKRKIAEGRKPYSLIDKFERFIRGGSSAWTIEATDMSVEIEPGGYTGGGDEAFSSLARWVQEAGYVGWFAISDDARKKIKRVLADSLREFLSKGAF